MRKVNFYLFLIIAAVALTSTGCKKFLAVDPAYTQDAENFFQTQEDYERALSLIHI
jgi:hypothetical protein